MKADSNISRALLDSVDYLARRGFHGDTIARVTGLTPSQVSYRTSKLHIRLRSYRDGLTAEAKEVISVTPCVLTHIRGKKNQAYDVAWLLPEVIAARNLRI